MRGVRGAATGLVLALLACGRAGAQTETATVPAAAAPIPLVERIPESLTITAEVTWFRIDRDGAPVGTVRFEYALATPPTSGADIVLTSEVEQAQGGVLQTQRSRWVFTRALGLVRFDEELSQPASGAAPGEDPARRMLRGEVSGDRVHARFEIPGTAPRDLEAVVPAGAIARYAATLALVEPANLTPGAVYTYRQLSPRTSQFAAVTTRVSADTTVLPGDPPRFVLETTSDEVPGLTVRSVVLARSPEHPNGVTFRSEQRGLGLRVDLVRVGEAEAREAQAAVRDRNKAGKH